MAKRPVRIQVHTRDHNTAEWSSAICYNDCGEFKLTLRGVLSDTDNYVEGIQSTNVDSLQQALVKSIATNNVARFKTLLNANFIYPGCVSKKTYTTDFHSRILDIEKQTWNARPNIEAVFIHNTSYFQHIVDALLKQNNEELTNEFKRALAETDLHAARLFEWEDEILTNLKERIQKIADYGNHLRTHNSDNKAVNKGYLIVTIAEELNVIIGKRNSLDIIEAEPGLETLKYKLLMLKTLHEHDDLINSHRGLKILVVNLLTALFTVGIANLINRVVNHSWCFFSKTTSQEKIDQAHQALLGADVETKFTL